MKQQVQHVDKNPQELNPSLKEFDALVKGNPKLRMLSEAMFEEIPHRGYVPTGTGSRNGN